MREAGRDDLTDLANKLDVATQGFYGSPQTVSAKEFMGHYARARMAWCKYSGEPLV